MSAGGGARTIPLRRPATLSMLPTPFVPERATGRFEIIESRWADVCARYPAAYDGRVCHVIGVHRNGCGGAVLHVADCAYRFFAVQDDDFDLGVRPLGVKGIVVREDRVLLGRRSPHVLGHAGTWEFAPGGAVEPGRTPAEAVTHELVEETGLGISADPTCLGLLYDEAVRTWEIVFRLEPGAVEGERSPEYDELRWCPLDDLPQPLSPIAERMRPWAERVASA